MGPEKMILFPLQFNKSGTVEKAGEWIQKI